MLLQTTRDLNDIEGLIAAMIVILVIGIVVDALFFGTAERWRPPPLGPPRHLTPRRLVCPGPTESSVWSTPVPASRQLKSMALKSRSFVSWWRALTRRTVPDRDRMTSDCVVAPLAS